MPACQFAACFRLEKRDLWIEGTAESTTDDFEAQTLSWLHRDLVVVARFDIDPANRYAGDVQRLRGGLVLVGVNLHDLGKIIDAEDARIGHAARRRQADGVESRRRVFRNIKP